MRKIASLAFIGTLLVLSACHRHGTGDTGDEYDFGIAPDIALALTIAPANPTVQVTPGQPVTTVLFTASIAGTVVPADWTTDRGELGAIDSGGTYTPTGNLGGKGLITASYMGLSATTTITIQYKLVQNGDPKCGMVGMIGAGGYGGVGGNGPGCAASPAQQGVLGGTPSSDSTISWLYPYDATVFPRGLLAPLMMWVPGAHDFDAMLVHMESKGGTFLYDGTFSKPPGAPFINMPIPQATWDVMNYSASGDEVTIKVSFAQGSTFVGPLTVKWRIAAGTLKGIVYYNSYGTGLVTNSDSDDASIPPAQYGAGTLSINPGATDPKLVAGLSSSGNGNGCRVCHSVTKDGSRFIT